MAHSEKLILVSAEELTRLRECDANVASRNLNIKYTEKGSNSIPLCKPHVNLGYQNSSHSSPLISKDAIESLLVSESPRVRLCPLESKSVKLSNFGRIILDVEHVKDLIACLYCKRLLCFQSVRNTGGNMRRHIHICPRLNLNQQQSIKAQTLPSKRRITKQAKSWNKWSPQREHHTSWKRG